MKLNFALPSWVSTALVVQGVEWDPVLLESVQPVVVVASDSAAGISGGAAGDDGYAYGGVIVRAGVAGQVSHTQLWNPADSGREVFVDQVDHYTTTANGVVSMRRHNVALANLYPTQAVPVYSDYPAAAAQLREQTNAAPLGALGELATMLVSVNVHARFTYPRTIRLLPGEGLNLTSNTLANNQIAAYFFRERALAV